MLLAGAPLGEIDLLPLGGELLRSHAKSVWAAGGPWLIPILPCGGRGFQWPRGRLGNLESFGYLPHLLLFFGGDAFQYNACRKTTGTFFGGS
jgi:hypothetical protein